MGVPKNRWTILENPTQMDELGGTPILGNLHMQKMILTYRIEIIVFLFL